MTKLQEKLASLEGAYAPNTIRAYYADARMFVDWCHEKQLEPFPLSSDTLQKLIEDMQVDFSYSSIRRKVSALKRLNSMLGFNDIQPTEDLYLTVRRLKRSKLIDQKQAMGINHHLLVQMISSQPQTLAGTRNRALLSLGYDFLARRSELIALRQDDIIFTADGALKGMIRKSKTDPYGRGRLVFGSERSAKLLEHWLQQKPKSIHAIFCAINHGQCLDRPICDRNVNNIIKNSVLRVKSDKKYNERDVSGHSLRVGAAQDLLIKGYDLATIMRAGGWSDPSTVSRYLRFSHQNVWK